MSEQQKSKVKLPPVDQIGIVVNDMDRAVEYYSCIFGWGPFQIREMKLEGITYRGQPGNCRLKIAQARLGPIEIELIQVLEGETPHTEFLRERGEGVQHLGFCVDDLEGMLTTLARDGIETVFYYNFPQGAFAYVNSDKIGGVMFELIEIREGFTL